MTSSYENLAVTRRGHVLDIVLNRPDAKNAITGRMHDEIIEAFESAGRDDALRAIVFASTGRVFSAGGDFETILEERKHIAARSKDMAVGAVRIFEAIACAPIPVVAALQGDAVGLGATLTLGCDAVVASRTARLSDPHVVIGLAAGDGGCTLWPQAVGFLRAKRYLLTGDRLNAEDAYAMGLITDLVDTPDDVLPAARALADRIAALPPLAVQGTKAALNLALRKRMDEAFGFAFQKELDTFGSEDLVEAIAALRERRPGRFTKR